MRNYKDDFFYQLVNALQKSGDYALSMAFQKHMMMQAANDQREHEQLVKEVAAEVLSHISATVDVQEVFDAIDGLNDKINSLGR